MIGTMQLLMLSAALATSAAQSETPAENLPKALQNKVAGTPVDCVKGRGRAQAARVVTEVDVTVVEGVGLLFEVDNKLYLNRPPAGLKNANVNSLVNLPPSSKICAGDSVQVDDTQDILVLGQFVPYTRAK